MKKKKIIIISLVVMLLVTSVITFSYAFWGMTNEQITMNKLTSCCLSITLEEEDAISLNNAFPITDEDGMKLKPYSFTINNTCDLFVSYNVSLEILKDSTLPIKYVRSMLNKEAVVNLNTLESTTKNISDSIDSKILTTGSLGSGDSADYTLRIWMDEDVTVDDTDAINKTLLSKVTITAVPSSYSPVANGFTLLNEALLVNEYQTTNVDVAKNKIASKQEVDFTKTAPTFIWQQYYSKNLTTTSAHRADKSLIGSYGVVDDLTKIRVGTKYTFDKETGHYIITDAKYYDPYELDYTNNTYYYCSNNLTTAGDNEVHGLDRSSCTTMFKLMGINEVQDTTIELSSGYLLPILRYVFDCEAYYIVEQESDKSDKGLYVAKDDYDDTYYYRGNVTNNYVKFAGNYWRIIRLNGDGSVRLLYVGNTVNGNNGDVSIGKSAFNTSMTDETYIGYMYSNTLDTSYQETIKNDNNSAIKTVLDNWYKANILDKGYSSYIADSGFCNDRSLSPSSAGDGYSNTYTSTYASTYRESQKSPSFICPNSSNDLFTLAGNNKGNESLTYPIGLVTIDEIMYAGSVIGKINTMTYTYSTRTYWTMTPYHYDVNNFDVRIWIPSQGGSLGYTMANLEYRVRPVINLKGDTEITGGIGTANDPFIVK